MRGEWEQMHRSASLETSFTRPPRDPTNASDDDGIYYLGRYQSMAAAVRSSLRSETDALSEPLAAAAKVLFDPLKETYPGERIGSVVGLLGGLVDGTVTDRGVYIETTVRQSGEFKDSFDTAINTDFELTTRVAIVNHLVDDLSVPIPISERRAVTEVHLDLLGDWLDGLEGVIASPKAGDRVLLAFVPQPNEDYRCSFRVVVTRAT